MKKISLRGISRILSEKELKNVMGGSYGSDGDTPYWCKSSNPTCTKQSDCSGSKICYTCTSDDKKYCA